MLDPTKGWFSAQELEGLPGVPESDSAVMRAAKKNLWVSRRKLRGKGIEYALASLPEATQKHLLGLVINHAVEASPALPAAPDAGPPAVAAPGNVVTVRGQVRKAASMVVMDDKKRAYQSAALILCRALDAAMAAADCSAKRACRELAERLVGGEVRPELLSAAQATYLKPRKAAGPLGGVEAQFSRLQKMMGFYEQGRLAGDVGLFLVPGSRAPEGHDPVHVMAFLRFYCLPSRPPVTEAYKKMLPWLAERGLAAPSYSTVCRIEQSLPVTVKYRGRVTGSEWRNLKPYIDRDVSMFHSNDIWVGDGHSFKAKVQHPIHGQPFTPEVTVIIDWVSRKIVGWSVALAESTVAVSDAFRHAQSVTRARPLVYYSDNGSGQTGKVIDCPVSGTLARQGIAHETGIPGNPQARGIIERLWQVTFIALAREYPTCTWRGADENATTKMLKLLNRKDQGGVRIPSFRQLLDDVARVVDDYNLHHEHRELDGNTPEDEYQARLDRDSIVFGPSEAELHALWMPEVVRVPQRGRVQLFGNTYCKADLVELLPEGAKVRVRYDLHNADTVWLLTMEGVFLGEARWDSHREAAFPVPQINQLRAERAAGKVRRGEKIIAEAQAELGEVIDLVPAVPSSPIDLINTISDADLAEMEARRPQAETLPDLLEMADEAPASDSPKPAPRDFMDMVMWLAADDLKKDAEDDADAPGSGKKSAAG
ncbi:MAG: DNA-binding protein [Opitutaceae bacterium]|nr:DNA-binding protein [Opitutaceae bacterium]